MKRKLKVFLSGSFKECREEFDLLEDWLQGSRLAFSAADAEVVRMDKYWETQTEYNTSNFEKIDYWLIDLDFLADCNVIILCKGWENHEGCRLEKKFAESLDILVVYSTDLVFERKGPIYDQT